MKRMKLFLLAFMLICAATFAPAPVEAQCRGCVPKSTYDFSTQEKVIKAIDNALRKFYSWF